jgi:hypothetical protein
MKIKGLEAIASAGTGSKPRSIPTRQRSSQIAVNLLRKEKERHQKELDRQAKREAFLRERMARIDAEIAQVLTVWQGEINAIVQENFGRATGAEPTNHPTGQGEFKAKKLRY